MPTGVRGRFQPSRVRGALRRVGRWTAAAIVLGLALIGFLHLTRRTGGSPRPGRVIGRDADCSWARRSSRSSATMATGAWLAPGNHVEVLLNGDETYPRLWEALRSARHSITLQLHYGAPGSQREPRRSP